MVDHVRVTVGVGYSMVPFGPTQAQNSSVISMAMAAPNILNNKTLALPNIKNLCRLLTYYVVSQLNCYLPFQL